MKEIISVKEAAERLGKSELHVRTCIDQGLYPFGICKKSAGGKKNQYEIFTRRMEAFLAGRDILSDKEIIEDLEDMYEILGRVITKARKGSV